MSARVDVLLEGYNYDDIELTKTHKSLVIRAGCNTCLVRSGGSNILFETGGPWQKDALLKRLEALKVHPDDVTHLVCSHGHVDHIGNLNLFANCNNQLVGSTCYNGDLFFSQYFHTKIDVPADQTKRNKPAFYYDGDYVIDFNTRVISTPGHTGDDVTLLVENCDKYGRVSLAGDLFENYKDLYDNEVWMSAGSLFPGAQFFNRDKIYAKSDWIFPGHGPHFKTTLY